VVMTGLGCEQRAGRLNGVVQQRPHDSQLSNNQPTSKQWVRQPTSVNPRKLSAARVP
jgi:hypothetical protein